MQRTDQQSHDRLVQHVAEWFRQQGASNVCADLPGYKTPARIFWKETDEGHVPDVTASLTGVSYLVEVETADTIENAHTESQWRLFSVNARQYGKKFIAAVPALSKQEAQRQLQALGLDGEVWGL